MIKKQPCVLIIGEHPIIPYIIRQFDSLDYRIVQSALFDENSFDGEWNNVFVISGGTGTSSENDAKAISTVEAIHKILVQHSTYRPVVHLLLRNHISMVLLRSREYNDEWHKVFELDVFTLDDIWAKNVVCNSFPDSEMRGLDYRPVTFESERRVHLVVFGTSNLTTALMENAALVAHYPNYVRNHNLRTRITIIDKDIKEWGHSFIGCHKSLMDNSYYRFVDIKNKHCELHKPMYESKREDFVDVEWEFVGGTIYDVVVQDKLTGWASDSEQILSIALCHDNDEKNIAQAKVITDMIYGYDIPVYLKQHTSALAHIISHSPRMQNVTLIGMQDTGYDTTLLLWQMAKRVKYVYDYCYENNICSDDDGCITAPSYIDDSEADRHWLQERRAIKRYSNICNAMTLSTKMRSLGHTMDTHRTFYAITQEEIELIARVEHNRWNVEELLLGFRPCNDAEQAEIESDISKKAEYKERLVHYDLRAYDDLRADDTGKNVNTYDICLSASIPLIAYEEEGGSK